MPRSLIKKHILKIRAIDKNIFNDIKSGKKTIETRAWSPKYSKIKSGDNLIFSCDGDRVEKEVLSVSHFKNIGTLLEKIDFNLIKPGATKKEDLIIMWESFPGYNEKIKKGGLLAWKIK